MSRESLVKRMGQKSLLAYSIAQSDKFETPKHINLISKKLEAVENGEIKRLCIFMPPRHGKSHMASEMFPAWYMGRNPQKNVILASYGQSLANDFGRKVKNQIAGEVFREVFGDIHLSQDSKSKSQFSLNTGGNYFAVGVGGSITGRGGDLIICDDLIKNSDDARSTTYQHSLREWYRTTLRTRLMPGGAIILIMTRWSDKDIASWILENDKEGEWDVLSLPAISDEGEALWPDKFSLKDLETIKHEQGTLNFNAMYQQKPSPDEGNVIKRQWIRYYRTLPEPLDMMVISVDTTFTDRATSDNCAITVLGRKRSSQMIYLVDYHVDKMNFVSALNNIKTMHKKYPKATVAIENSANGKALIETLRINMPNVVGVTPKGSKVSRVLNVAPSFEAGQIILPHPDIRFDVGDVVEELCCFPSAKFDDIPDSISQGILRLRYSSGERILEDLLEKYDENGNLIGVTPVQDDIRKLMWPDHDWELEDIKDPYDFVP